jgi:nucleotidyltransferase/DNA polymerase involved in DNA repair
MTAEEYKSAVKELTTIPGVGRTVADDLIQLGIKKVSDLKDKDADRLYHRSNREAGTVQDKSLLVIFRNAIQFSLSNTQDDEDLKDGSEKKKVYNNK